MPTASPITYALIALMTIPLRYLYYVGPFFAVSILILWILKREKKIPANLKASTTKASKAVARISAALIAIALMLGVVFSSPWLPEEQITINKDKPVTGYILALTSTGTVALVAKSRQIYYYDPNSSVNQKMCSNVSWNDFPVIYYLFMLHGDTRGYAHC
jgi:hypothetical protein